MKQSLLLSTEKALMADAGHSQTQQKLQEAQRDLEEQTKSLKQLQTELVNQQEQSESGKE